MAHDDVRARLADDVQVWAAEGLVSEETAAVLRERWRTHELGLAGVVRYLGIAGASIAGLGLLGLVTAVIGSELFATLAAAGLAAVFLWIGIALALDPSGRFATSSKAVIALGATALGGACALAVHLAGVPDDAPILGIVGLVWVPVVMVLAYRFRVRFALLLGLLGAIHAVGSWASMLDRSTYSLAIHSPPAMALFATGIVGVGIWHARALSDRFPGFHVTYEAIGLLYLDLSLLILSIDGHHGSHFFTGARLFWTLALTAATLGQIMLGARLKDARLMGFGVTFFGIDLFTRYYETLWDSLGQGLFFLLGGAALFGAGAAIEVWMRRRPA